MIFHLSTLLEEQNATTGNPGATGGKDSGIPEMEDWGKRRMITLAEQ